MGSSQSQTDEDQRTRVRKTRPRKHGKRKRGRMDRDVQYLAATTVHVQSEKEKTKGQIVGGTNYVTSDAKNFKSLFSRLKL